MSFVNILFTQTSNIRQKVRSFRSRQGRLDSLMTSNLIGISGTDKQYVRSGVSCLKSVTLRYSSLTSGSFTTTWNHRSCSTLKGTSLVKSRGTPYRSSFTRNVTDKSWVVYKCLTETESVKVVSVSVPSFSVTLRLRIKHVTVKIYFSDCLHRTLFVRRIRCSVVYKLGNCLLSLDIVRDKVTLVKLITI